MRKLLGRLLTRLFGTERVFVCQNPYVGQGYIFARLPRWWSVKTKQAVVERIKKDFLLIGSASIPAGVGLEFAKRLLPDPPQPWPPPLPQGKPPRGGSGTAPYISKETISQEAADLFSKEWLAVHQGPPGVTPQKIHREGAD